MRGNFTLFSNLQGCKKVKGRHRLRCPGKHVIARIQAVSGRSNFKGRNCCDREPRLHGNPFITKKQLYPQAGFSGNKNYKLVVLPLFAFRTLQVFLVQRDHSS